VSLSTKKTVCSHSLTSRALFVESVNSLLRRKNTF
jgi:hypothetical protein